MAPAYQFADLKIRTKDRKQIALRPNAVQEIYLDVMFPEWRDNPVGLRGLRELVLKARQFGFSTLILALFYLDTISVPNTQTVVLAHDKESTHRLFQTVKRFQRFLPEDRRPITQFDNKSELLWPDLDSYFFVGTAGSGEFGRGGTINNVHGSEVGFWPDAENLVAGLMEAVPFDGNIFLESTANGMANWYYDEYQAAKLGDSVFKPRFFAWNLHPEYRMPAPDGWVRTQEEDTLSRRYGLDDEQLAWRRWKKSTLRAKFAQEYPLDDDEAFDTSSSRILEEFIDRPAPNGHSVPFFVPARSWTSYLVIDPGWNRAGHLWAAVDPEGMVWLFAEYYPAKVRPGQKMRVLHGMWQAFGRPKVDSLMDPAGFDIKRTTTGQEAPSDADEYLREAQEIGATWFNPRPADNGDPQAYRVRAYLAADRVRVCDNLTSWRWERNRWVRQSPRSGRLAMEHRDPDAPIDKHNHLMDPTRYLFNELPEPRPQEQDEVDPRSLSGHWSRLKARQDAATRPRRGSDV